MEGEIISVLLAIVAILVSPLVYMISKQKKRLRCVIFPFLSLIDVREEAKSKIKIYYNEDLVENLSLMKIEIKNTGNQSINREAIVNPIEFKFDKKSSLIDYSVANTEPEGIDVDLEYDKENNLVRCSFKLLNSGDVVTLQFVCLGTSKKLPSVNARIEGIRQVDVFLFPISEEECEKRDKLVGVFYIIAGVSIILGIFGTIFLDLYDRYRGASIGIMLIIVGILAKKGYLHFLFKNIPMYTQYGSGKK
jgi:hypothetical protein